MLGLSRSAIGSRLLLPLMALSPYMAMQKIEPKIQLLLAFRFLYFNMEAWCILCVSLKHRLIILPFIEDIVIAFWNALHPRSVHQCHGRRAINNVTSWLKWHTRPHSPSSCLFFWFGSFPILWDGCIYLKQNKIKYLIPNFFLKINSFILILMELH